MNDSIKRVQSQAGLSFAERENQRSAAGGKANLRPEVKQKDFMKSAGRRGYSPLARVMTLAVMLIAMATTAWAQGTVTIKEGTADAAKWTVKTGTTTVVLGETEVAKDTTITATYTGSRHVKSVTAVTKAAEPAGNPAPTTAAIDAYTGGAFDWSGAGSAATVDVTINTFAANDGISILSAKNTNTAFTTTAGGASATFSGTATDDSKFYAVYPYTDGLTLSGDVISGVVIPSDQWNALWAGYDETSSWDPKAPIAYATTTGASLQFHNLCAILKIRPYWGGEGWITISADQDLAGTFSLDTSTGTLTATAGSKTVTIGSSSDWSKHVTAYGSYLYIAIAPGSYTNFKVRTDEDYGGGAEKTKASVTFEAGKIYDLGDVRPY